MSPDSVYDFDEWFRDSNRMDWRSMFTATAESPSVVRLIGTRDKRAEYAAVMWQRKMNWRKFVMTDIHSVDHTQAVPE